MEENKVIELESNNVENNDVEDNGVADNEYLDEIFEDIENSFQVLEVKSDISTSDDIRILGDYGIRIINQLMNNSIAYAEENKRLKEEIESLKKLNKEDRLEVDAEEE